MVGRRSAWFWVLVVLGLLGVVCQTAVAAQGARPTIERQWVTGITSRDAILHARIGLSRGGSMIYRFQIDTTGRFRFARNDGCLLHLPGTMCTQALVDGDPLPPGIVVPPEVSTKAGRNPQEVSLRLASIGTALRTGVTYHYRVVAGNARGMVEGPRRVFVAGGPRCAPLPCRRYSKHCHRARPRKAKRNEPQTSSRQQGICVSAASVAKTRETPRL
jgi:hypothetical protein